VLLPVSCGLAVLTAIALLLLAASVQTAPSILADASAQPANQRTVRQFYEGVNRVLRGGDDAALSRDFVPEVLTPVATPGQPSLAGALVDRLTALRRTYPDLQFTVETVVAEGDLVIAQITAAATLRQSESGLAIDGPPLAWSGTDRFRFEDGLIVEYVAGWEAIAVPDAGWTVTVDDPPDGKILVAVVRFTLLSGTSLPPIAAGGPAVYVVESGRVLAGSSDAPIAGAKAPEALFTFVGSQSEGEPLLAGDHLVVPAGAWVTLGNHDPTAAVVLGVMFVPYTPPPYDEAGAAQSIADQVLAMYAPADGPGPKVVWPPGLTVRGLAATVIDGSGPRPLVVTGDPTVLALGETIGAHRVNNVEFLMVEAGTAGLEATSPALHDNRALDSVRSADPGVVDESRAADGKTDALSTGDSATIVGGSVQSVRNVGDAPLSVLVLTVTPGDLPQ
jgi:predicted ester cyclase